MVHKEVVCRDYYSVQELRLKVYGDDTFTMPAKYLLNSAAA
jgi:hypothetical protein